MHEWLISGMPPSNTVEGAGDVVGLLEGGGEGVGRIEIGGLVGAGCDQIKITALVSAMRFMITGQNTALGSSTGRGQWRAAVSAGEVRTGGKRPRPVAIMAAITGSKVRDPCPGRMHPAM